ncbi:MAG: hypothetical protein ABEH38_07050, partial [Flavobacteriales bacterium]
SWTAKPKWDLLQSSDQGGPDLMVDLSEGRSVALDRIMSEVPAGLRIGQYRKERAPFYELMLETKEEEGVGELCERILRYLEPMMKPKT